MVYSGYGDGLRISVGSDADAWIASCWHQKTIGVQFFVVDF